MSLCPLSPATSVLRPLAMWCLDTFGDGPPMLVGVMLGADKVHMHPIELADDPLLDMTNLVAPDEWDFLVLVASATTIGSRFDGGTISHAVDRNGGSATELDEWCGRRRSLRLIRGQLHDACVAVFVSTPNVGNGSLG